MQEPDPNATTGETSKSSEYTLTQIPEGGHVEFRRCVKCGSEEMAPHSSFAGTGLGSQSERGFIYRCPDCGSDVKILDSGGLFMGTLYSFFWGAVGLWAFYSGPYWYLRHLDIFSGDSSMSYGLADIGIILFAIAIMAFSVWIIWTFLVEPMKILVTHPVVGENRAKTEIEVKQSSKSRRTSLISFFVLPLFLWIPLFGAMWLLDLIGLDLRDNKFIVVLFLGALLGAVGTYGKRYGANVVYAFLGMAFWMAVFLGMIFLFA